MSGGFGADKFNCGSGNDRVIDFNESEGDMIWAIANSNICEDYSCPDGMEQTTGEGRDSVRNPILVQSCIDESKLGAMNASKQIDSKDSKANPIDVDSSIGQVERDDTPPVEGGQEIKPGDEQQIPQADDNEKINMTK